MGNFAKTAGAEAISQHIDILEVADGGQPQISLAGDHPSHGTGDGVDGDLDGHIGVEIIDGVHQVDKGACLVGIDQPRQLAKVGIEDAHRFRRLGGGVVFRSLRQAESRAAEQGDHEQQKGDVSGHDVSLLVMGQLKCSQTVASAPRPGHHG